MICISILRFGHIANKFKDILSILKLVIIFLRKVTYFVLAKQIGIPYNQNSTFSFVEFPYEGKKLAAYAEEMPTTIYLHMETLKKVGRKVTILVFTIRNQ